MKWGMLSIVAFVLLVGVGARWYVDGAQIFTKTAQQITVRDELFGTESVEWEEGLWLGLDVAGPAALVFLGVGVFGVIRQRRQQGR